MCGPWILLEVKVPNLKWTDCIGCCHHPNWREYLAATSNLTVSSCPLLTPSLKWAISLGHSVWLVQLLDFATVQFKNSCVELSSLHAARCYVGNMPVSTVFATRILCMCTYDKRNYWRSFYFYHYLPRSIPVCVYLMWGFLPWNGLSNLEREEGGREGRKGGVGGRRGNHWCWQGKS